MSGEITPAMRRADLIDMLRDRTRWPEGFVWEFSNCHRCGMGLLLEKYGYGPVEVGTQARIAELLGLSLLQVAAVFTIPSRGFENPHERLAAMALVTPEMVADRLEVVHRQIGFVQSR